MQSFGGWTALIQAAINGHIGIVKYLVEERKAQVDAKSNVSYKKKQCTVYQKQPPI